jgi:4-amino-4-deoxy-L-arabinose transferase-like glycosyltransferase
MSFTVEEHPPRHDAGKSSAAAKPLLAIISAAALLRVLSLLLSENAGGDALARAQLTARWLQNPGLELHFDVWLPLHFWMMGAVSALVGDVELGCRLLSLLLGVASVGAMWVLVRELDGAGAALYSSIVFALYSLHIAYSGTSSVDVPYLFFVLAGLALFFRGRRTGKTWLLLAGGLSLTLGAGMRYEAWVVIVASCAMLLYRMEFKRLLFFLPAAGAWPAFWMAYEWVTRGHPLYSPALNYSWVAKDLSAYGTPLLYRLLLPPGVVLITLTPVAVAGFLLSARRVWERRGALAEFAFILGFFAAVQFYQIAAGGTMAYARYTLTLGAMVATLAGVGLYRSFPRPWLVAGVMLANLAALFLLSYVNNPFINKARSVSPVLHFTTYLEETGRYLRNHLGPDEAVVLDDYNYETNQIAAVAGQPLVGSGRAFLFPDRVDPEKQKQKFAELLPYLRSRRPRYLVYAPQGELRQFLLLPAECSSAQVEEMQFACVFQNAQYHIYEIHYPPPTPESR